MENEELTMLPVSAIYPHPDNPRKDVGDVTELADSIKKRGILQNLTVMPGTGSHWKRWQQSLKRTPKTRPMSSRS